MGHPALGLLSGPFDDDPEAFYNSLGTYNQAVLLNTAAALADAGVNMSNATSSASIAGANRKLLHSALK